MARRINYTFKGQQKTISFANDRYRSLHEAVADAEGIDLRNYLMMEQQVERSGGSGAMRQYRDSEFKRMGFSNICFERD